MEVTYNGHTTVLGAAIYETGSLLDFLRRYQPPAPNIDRAVYHLESALYQLQHPTNEIPQTKTDATSV